jgi:hypothetical protein
VSKLERLNQVAKQNSNRDEKEFEIYIVDFEFESGHVFFIRA